MESTAVRPSLALVLLLSWSPSPSPVHLQGLDSNVLLTCCLLLLRLWVGTEGSERDVSPVICWTGWSEEMVSLPGNVPVCLPVIWQSFSLTGSSFACDDIHFRDLALASVILFHPVLLISFSPSPHLHHPLFLILSFFPLTILFTDCSKRVVPVPRTLCPAGRRRAA